MCLFCDIIDHKIPCHKLYESEKVIAFLDISQVTKGHTLVLPKKHVKNLLECDNETLHEVFDVVSKLGSKIMLETGAKGMNFLSNLNEVAGQSISHFHVHIIPRFHQDDACEIVFHKSDEQDFSELVRLLQMNQ